MARYEIVGLFDCPWYAKAEKLSEELTVHFSTIEIRKTMKDQFQWSDFVDRMKVGRGWTIKSSPVIWEVLTEPHAKLNLIGDINDFCEYVREIYGIVTEATSHQLKERAKSNALLFAKGFNGQDRGDQKICNLTLIGGSSKLLNCLLPSLLSPISITPPQILFNIRIYNDGMSEREIEGVCMEVTDLGSASLFNVAGGHLLSELVYNAHLILILEDFSRRIEETVHDWLYRIESKSVIYGKAVAEYASDESKLLVGGDGPQCYVAQILRQIIPKSKIGSGELIGIGQHIISRAKAYMSPKIQVSPGSIRNVSGWGWPGSVGAFIEVHEALYKDGDGSIQGPDPCQIPLAQIALNPQWLFNQFSTEFLEDQKRQIGNLSARRSWDMGLAEGTLTTLHLWLLSSYGVEFRGRELLCCEQFPNYSNSFPSGESLESSEMILPVISVALPTTSVSDGSLFPRGTFMVQPGVCLNGKWAPAGKISEGVQNRMIKEVNKLWAERLDLIFKDSHLSLSLLPSEDEDFDGKNKDFIIESFGEDDHHDNLGANNVEENKD